MTTSHHECWAGCNVTLMVTSTAVTWMMLILHVTGVVSLPWSTMATPFLLALLVLWVSVAQNALRRRRLRRRRLSRRG